MRLVLASFVALALAIPAADARGAAKQKVALQPKAKAKAKASAPKGKPSKAPEPLACGESGGVQIAIADPLRPLSVATAGSLSAVGPACCASWARAGATWSVIDRLGAVVSEAEVVARDGAVGPCADVSLVTKSGKFGSGLIVRGAVVPQASFAPTPAQRGALAKTVASVEKERVPTRSWACLTMPFPVELRTIAFTVVSSTAGAQHWAVVGGEVLVVAKLEGDGMWSPKLVRALAPDGCHPQAYVARAVFDADGDGRPELFVHEEVGDAATELVLTIGADDGVRVRSL